MKRLIHAKTVENMLGSMLKEITCLVVVDDVNNCNPKDLYYIEAATKNNIDYTSLTRDQLLQLSKKEIESIHNINVLRKLKKEELTIQQLREVTQANMQNSLNSLSEVREVLKKIKECDSVYVWPIEKNESFRAQLKSQGCRMSESDVLEILKKLHIKDYSYSTCSYLDTNWNSLLMVFEYVGDHIFEGHKGDQPVEITGLDIYIKLDINSISGKSIGAMSFHNPEFKLPHPYKDYSVDKED